MARLKIGDPAPYFNLRDQDENERIIDDFKGQWLVIYFYPDDDAPESYTEAIGFTNLIEEFQALNAQVIGISSDDVQEHKEFIDKNDLKIILLSDIICSVIKEYGAHKLEGVHISQNTILVDPSGKIAFIWRAVNPEKHPAEVKAKLEELARGKQRRAK